MKTANTTKIKVNNYHIINYATENDIFCEKPKKTVKLNVGGVHFKTSLLTVTKDPNSMLSALFSGQFEEDLDEDGSYFIDRDGDLFR